MVMHFRWFPMHFKVFHKCSIDFHGFSSMCYKFFIDDPRIFMRFRWVSQISTIVYDLLSISHEIPVSFQRFSIGFHWFSSMCHRCSLISYGFHQFLQNTMSWISHECSHIFRWFSRNLHVFHGFSVSFLNVRRCATDVQMFDFLRIYIDFKAFSMSLMHVPKSSVLFHGFPKIS